MLRHKFPTLRICKDRTPAVMYLTDCICAFLLCLWKVEVCLRPFLRHTIHDVSCGRNPRIGMQRFPVCSVNVQFQVHRFLLPLFHCSTQGNSCHNTCYEYFFKYLKKEEPNCKCYHSLQELQLSIFEYIEGYYNSKRPHSIYLLQTKQKLSIRSRICKAVPDYFFTFLSTSLTVL